MRIYTHTKKEEGGREEYEIRKRKREERRKGNTYTFHKWFFFLSAIFLPLPPTQAKAGSHKPYSYSIIELHSYFHIHIHMLAQSLLCVWVPCPSPTWPLSTIKIMLLREMLQLTPQCILPVNLSSPLPFCPTNLVSILILSPFYTTPSIIK